GRSLKSRGFTESEILSALIMANKRRCVPLLPRKEVEQIAHSAATMPDRREFTAQYNGTGERLSKPSREGFQAARSGAHATRARAIEQAPLTWLWENWIVTGELTLLIGDPSVGKSLVWIDLVARITSGRALPGSSKQIAGNVLAYTAEESRGRIIVPR